MSRMALCGRGTCAAEPMNKRWLPSEMRRHSLVPTAAGPQDCTHCEIISRFHWWIAFSPLPVTLTLGTFFWAVPFLFLPYNLLDICLFLPPFRA
jgi:hypothetical protein